MPGSDADHHVKYIILDNDYEADFNILQFTMVNIIVVIMLSLYVLERQHMPQRQLQQPHA